MGHHDSLEAAIANYELAFRMQTAVPEPDRPRRASRAATQAALRARRPVRADADLRPASACSPAGWSSAGVRFVELLCPSVGGDRWDQHGDLKDGHENNARAVDRPIAGLLKDLKARGLLDSTLVVWGGEFGRTPMAQGTDGRDHNPYGFTIWLAGGGIKGGTIHGATDDYGYHAVEDKVEVHDLHATMLHLLGHGPQAADLPLQRPRHAADRRPRRGRPRHPRLIHGPVDGVRIGRARLPPSREAPPTADPPGWPGTAAAVPREDGPRPHRPGHRCAPPRPPGSGAPAIPRLGGSLALPREPDSITRTVNEPWGPPKTRPKSFIHRHLRKIGFGRQIGAARRASGADRGARTARQGPGIG